MDHRTTDLREIRTALQRIETALGQEANFTDLQRDHIELQHTHELLQRHVQNLHAQTRAATDTANAFMAHCQGRYAEAAAELQRAQLEIASLTQTAARLQTEVRELDEIRVQYEQLQAAGLSPTQEPGNGVARLRPGPPFVEAALNLGRTRELASMLDLMRDNWGRDRSELATTRADLSHLLQRHRELLAADAVLTVAANRSRDQVDTLGRRVQALRQDTAQLVEQLREQLHESERLTARFRGECETTRSQFEASQRDLVVARQARSLAEAHRTRAQRTAQDYGKLGECSRYCLHLLIWVRIDRRESDPVFAGQSLQSGRQRSLVWTAQAFP